MRVLGKDLDRLYTYLLARPCFERVNRLLFRLSSHGLGLNNFSDDGLLTGEKWFLRQIADLFGEAIVFDVGANEGAWSRSVLKTIPRASIYAFEPNKILAERLSSISERIYVHNVGLSSAPSRAFLYDYADRQGSAHGSFVSGVIEEDSWRSIKVIAGRDDDD